MSKTFDENRVPCEYVGERSKKRCSCVPFVSHYWEKKPYCTRHFKTISGVHRKPPAAKGNSSSQPARKANKQGGEKNDARSVNVDSSQSERTSNPTDIPSPGRDEGLITTAIRESLEYIDSASPASTANATQSATDSPELSPEMLESVYGGATVIESQIDGLLRSRGLSCRGFVQRLRERDPKNMIAGRFLKEFPAAASRRSGALDQNSTNGDIVRETLFALIATIKQNSNSANEKPTARSSETPSLPKHETSSAVPQNRKDNIEESVEESVENFEKEFNIKI